MFPMDLRTHFSLTEDFKKAMVLYVSGKQMPVD